MPPKDESKWEYPAEYLARNRVSGIYYAVKYFRGMPPLNKSLKTLELREAKRLLPLKIKEHLEKFGDGKRVGGNSPTIAEVIEEIERVEGPGLKKKTRAQRAFYFKRIRDEMKLGHLSIDSITLKVFASRLERVRLYHREEAERTGALLRKTYWGYTKNMNVLLRFGYEQRYTSHWLTIPNPDEAHKEGVVFRKEELLQLWEVMSEDTRDQFVLSYECCMRLREMLHLTWDRVDLDSGEIRLRAEDVKTGSKTGKGRQFYMTENALTRLRTRFARRHEARFFRREGESDAELQNRARSACDKWVFPSPTGKGPVDDNDVAWNRAKKDVLEGSVRRGTKANPSFQHWGTWHHLRHTAITRMLVEQKVNITLVSEYVGTSVSTLQKVYLHSRAEHTKGVTAALRITGE